MTSILPGEVVVVTPGVVLAAVVRISGEQNH